MRAVPPDYDSDPERWRAWEAPQDVHEMIAPALRGRVLDVGCGDGRLASLVRAGVSWIGVDSSAAQLGANPY
jgi:SAM-dependent methyltransferase